MISANQNKDPDHGCRARNLIQGNEIGTDVAGTVALGNAFWSVELWQVVGNGGGGGQALSRGATRG